MTERAEFAAPGRVRVGVAAFVLLLHIVAVLALIRAFAPDFATEVAERVTSAFTVTVSTPPPAPSPSPRAPEAEGAAAPAGRRAQPKQATAPRPKIAIAERRPAPPVAATGSAATSGARDASAGSGAGGQGSGVGAGSGGAGPGGGLAAKPVKIAGEINSARDYPRETRDLRIGDHLIIALTVGADGRVRGCRVQRASRDAEADRITCRLATERFRFRPATDAAGRPVEAIFGWRQRWFYPPEKN
ncbi:MAG TPA: energy transducer TonB [Novosphingobium sp.]